MNKNFSGLVNKSGAPIVNNVVNKTPTKQAANLFGNIFNQANAGRYKYRYYTLQDSNQGIDTYSRELLVRWSREMAAQLPVVTSAIKLLSQFAVSNAYIPEYIGNNSAWGKVATDWLKDEWMPNCCTRGNSYDWQTCLNLFSQTLDVDGDFLQVFGQDKYGFPMFQIIPTHRIRNMGRDGQITMEGEFKDCINQDGVIYTLQGKAVGFTVDNANNLVNTLAKQTDSIIFNNKDAHLVFDVKYFDKHRGIPSIGAAILQAISLQELDQYEMDKAKMQSMVGLVEKTPTGEAPQELQNTLQDLLSQSTTTGNALMITPNDHAVRIINGPEIRYVRAEGGDIKSFQSNGPTSDAQEYMTKLETQVLATLGVPHQLLFSTTKVGGRVTSAVAEMFRKTIADRQKLLDKHAKFTVGWALAKAIDAGLIPDNKEENLTKVFEFTKPQEFSLDSRYDNDIVITNLDKGIISLNEATKIISNKTSSEVMEEQAKDLTQFYKLADRKKEQKFKSGF